MTGMFVWTAFGKTLHQTSAQASPRTEKQGVASAPIAEDKALDLIIAREHQEIPTIRRYKPIIETYIQDVTPDPKAGAVPVHDHYFLGQADLSKGVVDNPMINQGKKKHDTISPISHLNGMFTSSYVPEGFLQMVYIDPTGFDRRHYKFHYLREENLGDVHCVVFEISPLPKSGKGRFNGHFWAETQGYTIVRFKGVYTPVVGANGVNLHFDSWRLNLQPGLWLPAYIFSQESDLKLYSGERERHVRFISQTRLWGYSLKDAGHLEEFGELTIESPNAINDQSARDRSPIEAQRDWRHEAERNVLDALQRTGLLAPPGEADGVLEKVVNNLISENNLDFDPDIHCRVMLTETLELFAVGHTIVLSRGLLDVLPDEVSLATMLAQELADIMVTQATLDQWGFNDAPTVTVTEAMNRFSFKDSPEQVQLASQKAFEILQKSQYKDKLASAGLFLTQLDADSKALPALINSHLGNRVYLAAQLMALASNPESATTKQTSALLIGSRVYLDPWSDQIELMKDKPAPLSSASGRTAFEVASFMPFLAPYGSSISQERATTFDDLR